MTESPAARTERRVRAVERFLDSWLALFLPPSVERGIADLVKFYRAVHAIGEARHMLEGMIERERARKAEGA